jgi:hypothetical protein
MTLPEELQPLLPETPAATARISSGLDGPVGETWLVATASGLRAFTRESMFKDFTELDLDPAHPPRLEGGTFADTLFLAVAGGTVHEVSVSSFERQDVQQVLESGPQPSESAPEVLQLAAPEPAIAPEGEQPYPTPEPEDEQPPPVIEAAEPEPVFENRGTFSTEDERRIQELLKRDEYYGMTFSAGGCVAMLLGIAVPIVALWILNETLTLDIIANNWGAEAATETWLYVGRVVAVVFGLIIGVRLVRTIVRSMQKAGKLGSVTFSRDALRVVGVRGEWRETIDLTKPFDMQFVYQPHGPEARMPTPAIVLEQGDAKVALRTFGEPYVQVVDAQVLWHDQPAEPPGSKGLVLEKRVFAAVARRLLGYVRGPESTP